MARNCKKKTLSEGPGLSGLQPSTIQPLKTLSEWPGNVKKTLSEGPGLSGLLPSTIQPLKTLSEGPGFIYI